MATTTIQVPATTPRYGQRVDAATVEYDPATGTVTLGGQAIGTVAKGEQTAQVGGNDRRGSAYRFVGVTDWTALAPGERRSGYSGDSFPAYTRKNTRKAAIAYLVARAAGHGPDARYFTWA